MIYYSDNPNLGVKTVVTYNGNVEYRMNCRKIKDYGFFIKNKDCFYINNTWYRINSGLIAFDEETKIWKLIKNSNMIKGIIRIENNIPIFGYFTPNLTKNVQVQDMNGSNFVAISEDSIIKDSVENLSTGIFLLNPTQAVYSECFKIKNIIPHKNKGYNIEDNEIEMLAKKQVFSEYNMVINPLVLKYSKFLENTTFGVELETIRGYLPEHLQWQNGTVVCRDGSLHDDDGTQGAEFVTIPLQGEKGIQCLINLSKSLQKRTHIDHKCSFHLHLGNIPTNKLFLITLYRLSVMIQDEIFEIFPYYKNDEITYAGKDKNYSKKLDRIFSRNRFSFNKDNYNFFIKENYGRLFNLLSGGHYPSRDFNRKNKRHPKHNKWERSGRYYWINFMNTIFSNRNTIEFRIHTATTNPQKIVTWLFICNAIVKTAIHRANDILNNKNITLSECLDFYSKKGRVGLELSDYLKSYVLYRKKYFEEKTILKDYMVNSEIQQDSNFRFNYNEITKMFYE